VRQLLGTRRWRLRAAGALVLGALGYGVAVLLDFDPQPLPFAVVVVIVYATFYLVVDVADAPAAEWQHALAAPADRVDEVTSDLRIITSHQQADRPTDGLAIRLVELARSRDPALAAEIRQELAGVRRIPPADIDRILTRIEDVRDRR
jgi:hypothetical protein